MPTFVLTCGSCGARKPFFLDEWVVDELQGGSPVEKHCSVCRGMTKWTLTLQDRRTGRDRRLGPERRAAS